MTHHAVLYVLRRQTFRAFYCLVQEMASERDLDDGKYDVTQVAKQEASLPVLKERRPKNAELDPHSVFRINSQFVENGTGKTANEDTPLPVKDFTRGLRCLFISFEVSCPFVFVKKGIQWHKLTLAGCSLQLGDSCIRVHNCVLLPFLFFATYYTHKYKNEQRL